VVLVSLISIIAILSVNYFSIAVIYAAESLGFTQLQQYASYMQVLIGFISIGYGLLRVSLYLWNLHRNNQSKIKRNSEEEYLSSLQKNLTVNLVESCTTLGGHSYSFNNKADTLALPKSNPEGRRNSLITQDSEEIEEIIDSLRGETIKDVVRTVFPMIVLSELGDKSMLTTLLLASSFSLPAVCLGVMSGVMLCIPMAACIGSSQYLDIIDFDLIASIMMILIGGLLLLFPSVC